jgi:hypothetical protein
VNLREQLQKRPATGIGLGIAVVAVACVFIFRQGSNSSGQSFVSSAYYTVDDGKTYFADSFLKPYPFDHNGQQAVRACVYQVPGGQPFVAYLERYTDAGKAQVAPLLGSDDVVKQQQYVAIRGTELEVKRPGDKVWVAAGSGRGASVMNVGPRPGSTAQPAMVNP